MDTLDVEEPVTIRHESLQALLETVPDARRQVVQTWIDGLKAMKWSWDVVAKRKVFEPDHKERRENAKLLAAYLDGNPTETTVVKVAGGPGDPMKAVMEAARESPAVREALHEMLDELERPALPS